MLTPALLAWSWSRPQPAPPMEVPPLTLAPNEVRAALAARAALEEPTGPEADARRAIYRETNVAEHEATDYPGQAQLRRERLVEALSALVTAAGEDAIPATRHADVERALLALRGELPDDERTDELGGFVRMMDRYSMAAEGRQIAPMFVVRTALAARWNAIHGRPLTEGFEPIELQAYWGWLALHAVNAPAERRFEALEHYAAAGGPRAAEARGVLLFEAGEGEAASEAFVEAFEAAGTFRLRNHAIAAAPE
ncbi:MAG: hypothetical protein H6719_13375 [Sandaracinaceae bacterium]|nr:hypothetical protein [Sandaracinaceae bacterium]